MSGVKKSNGKSTHFRTASVVFHPRPKAPANDQPLEEPSAFVAFCTYFIYYMLIVFGKFRDTLRNLNIEKKKGSVDNNPDDFVSLYPGFEGFFIRNFYKRLCDNFNRPVVSVPGAEIELLDRTTDDYNWTFKYPGTTTKHLNLGSYNYLGFAENDGTSSSAAIKSIHDFGTATASPRTELGTLRCHVELETLMAKFLGTEAALVFGMGFATNSLNIPTLVDKHCLIMSDEYNHTSLVLGSRLSGAKVCVFKHNNPEDLEMKLRKCIIEGHKRKKWKKILIIVEGVYSMEGTIVRLPEIIAIKKKYNCYLYVDEAHSIGAVGPNGRGVVDYWGCDPRDVDIMMGTFTKSFGSAGGYLAGSKKVIDYLKSHSHGHTYSSSMSAPVCWQIIRTVEIIMGLDGTKDGVARIQQLNQNTRYFRDKLVKMGFVVLGNEDSPVVPCMLFMLSKVGAFSNRMLDRNIAVVVVGFPATPILGARVRFCLSASHTREMLDKALEAIDQIGDEISIKYSKFNPPRSFSQVKQMDADSAAAAALLALKDSSKLKKETSTST